MLLEKDDFIIISTLLKKKASSDLFISTYRITQFSHP